MKKLKRCACGLFILIFALVLAFGSGCSSVFATFGILVGTAIDGLTNQPSVNEEAANRFEHWGVTLPTNAEVKYSYNDIGWFSEGSIYYAIDCGEAPAAAGEFSCEHSDDFESTINSNINYLETRSGEDIAIRPDWEEEYCWKIFERDKNDGKETDSLHVCYFSENFMLYAVFDYM